MNGKLYNLLFKGWFRTKGRSGRKEYICRFLMMPLFYGVASFLFDIFHSDENSIFGFISGTMAALFFSPLFILSIIQIFFVTHRRLHDLNASGWWQLVTFIPFGQILMIGFIFFKGTPTANKYGEPPID